MACRDQTGVATGRFRHDRRNRPEHYLPLIRSGDRDREFVWQYCARAIGIENP